MDLSEASLTDFEQTCLAANDETLAALVRAVAERLGTGPYPDWNVFEREVLPHASDAWIDDAKTRIGYEINFNRYFYKPKPLRSLEEIRADIDALEQETEGLLEQILVEVEER